jgi:hypothetical protein
MPNEPTGCIWDSYTVRTATVNKVIAAMTF